MHDSIFYYAHGIFNTKPTKETTKIKILKMKLNGFKSSR